MTPFGLQVDPRLATTDFIGEHMIGGGPSVFGNTDWSAAGPQQTDGQAGGDAYSANDAIAEDADLGNVAFDGVIRCAHQQEMFVPHDNVFASNYGTTGPGPATNPEVGWYNYLGDAEFPNIFTYFRQPVGYNAMRYESDAVVFDDPGAGGNSFSMVGSAAVACQGFSAFVSFQPPYGIDTPEDAAGFAEAPFVAILWRVNGSSNTAHRWYALVILLGSNPQFTYNDYNDVNGLPVDGYWVLVEAIKPGANTAEILNGHQSGPYDFQHDADYGFAGIDGFPMSPEHKVLIKFAAGQIQVKLNADTDPFVWPHDVRDTNGVPDWCIDLFMFSAQNVYTVDWSFHPTKFCAVSQIVSTYQNASTMLTEAQITGMTARVHCLPNVGVMDAEGNPSSIFNSNQPGWMPPGSQVYATMFDVAQYSLFRYNLLMMGPFNGEYLEQIYSNFSPMVFAVTLEFPGTVQSVGWTPVILGSGSPAPPAPESIQVTSTFDINTLSVRTSAKLRFPNFDGTWTNGSNTGWLDKLGVWGTQINLGSQGWDDDGNVINNGGRYRVFTGMANMDFANMWGGQGRDYVEISCDDFWTMLDVPIWDLKFFDAYNAYYCMYELAKIAGLSDAQIGFMQYVPDDPYSYSPSLSDSQQIFMPSGPSGTPTTRFAPGSKARDMMLKISYSIGMALFFDPWGVLQFQTWMPNGGWNGAANVYYSEYAGQATTDLATCGLADGADQIFGGTFRGSLRETRSTFVVMGPRLNATAWDIISSSFENTDMVLYDGWDSQPIANYLGFRSRVVWTDNIFASQAYADTALAQLANFLTIPDREVSFTAFDKPGQPIYPGYLVRAMYSRSGSTGFTMFVTGVTWNHTKGQAPTVNVTARIIPEGWSPVG